MYGLYIRYYPTKFLILECGSKASDKCSTDKDKSLADPRDTVIWVRRHRKKRQSKGQALTKFGTVLVKAGQNVLKWKRGKEAMTFLLKDAEFVTDRCLHKKWWSFQGFEGHEASKAHRRRYQTET